VIEPSLRILVIASILWLASSSAFVVSLLSELWQGSPIAGLVRGLLFLGLGVCLSFLGAAWVAWFARNKRDRRLRSPG
jgi:hypothetical protein